MKYNLSKLEAIAEGDQDFILKVLEVFVAEVSEDLKRMKDFLKSNEFEEISKIAHKIKPNLILLGISSAVEHCLIIEKNRLKPIALERFKYHLDSLDNIVCAVIKELRLAYKLE